MKTKGELKIIAGDIYQKVRAFVKSHGMLETLSKYGDIKKDTEQYYLELRTEYNLTDEENHKVDHLFSRASVLGSGREWRQRKKYESNFGKVDKDG